MTIKTPFYDKHAKLGGHVVDFHGWFLSMMFSGIPDEHMAVRENVGMFDVSHMGNFTIKGKGATDFLNETLTNRFDNAKMFQCRYCHILQDDGKIIDDNIVSKIGDEDYFCVPNATMIKTDFNWYTKHAPKTVKIENLSDKYGILALQGPKAKLVMQKVTDFDVSSVKFFFCGMMRIKGLEHDTLVWRTGYTGEDGFEIMVPQKDASHIWDAIYEAGKEFGIKPIGLGARDTLRLEKGLLLSGQDFNYDRTTVETYQSGQFALNMNHEFRGKKVLEQQLAKDDYWRIIGIDIGRGGIPRTGYEVVHSGKVISKVTSGTFVPTTKKGIAMAYLPPELAKSGVELSIRIRGKDIPGKVFSFRDKT